MKQPQIEWDVEYRGVSGTKQHMFSDAGSPVVSHVFDTLDQALAQFGKRIKIDDRAYRFSAGYRAGLESKTYSPRSGADKQERLEYGLGYLRRKLTEAATPKDAIRDYIMKSAADAIKRPSPNLITGTGAGNATPPTKAALSQSIANIAKKRGRSPKAQ